MSRPHSYGALTAGSLLLPFVISSCASFSVFSSEKTEIPGSLGARMEKHTEILQKDIDAKSANQPQAMKMAAKYISDSFSDMGYAVTLQPVSGRDEKKGSVTYNILVYKPGLCSNNQSFVVGAHYDSSDLDNNGSGAAQLLEIARDLKDIPINHNIYFVAYANGTNPAGASASSGAYIHAKNLNGRIGAANILGMINLEPMKPTIHGGQKQEGPGSPKKTVLFKTTPRGEEFASQCATPFAKTWEQSPSISHRNSSSITGNDRHYAIMDIPTLSCQCKYPVTDAHTEKYVRALTDMIHQVADHDTPKQRGDTTPDKKPPQQMTGQTGQGNMLPR